MFRDETGGSKLAPLIYLLAAALVLYVFIKVIPPYMDYYSMDDEAAQEVRMAAINPDAVILDDLYRKAQELKLPIDKDDIALTHTDGSVTVDMKWTTEVDFGHVFKRDFSFEVRESTQKKAP